MATGYTEAIAEGISFEKFTWKCAKAFSACILLRDQPSNTPVTAKTVSDASTYYEERLICVNKNLADFDNLTPRQIKVRTNKHNKSTLQTYQETITEKQELLKKYNDMLVAVNAWVPPSADHTELKKFMIEQINDSVKHDCMLSYVSKPIVLTTAEWCAAQRKHLLWEIEYYKKHVAEQKSLNETRLTWIKQLEQSIGPYQ